jgi:hypothetical protein
MQRQGSIAALMVFKQAHAEALIALRRCCMQVLSIENVLPALQALPTVAHVELAVAALFDVSQVRMTPAFGTQGCMTARDPQTVLCCLRCIICWRGDTACRLCCLVSGGDLVLYVPGPRCCEA